MVSKGFQTAIVRPIKNIIDGGGILQIVVIGKLRSGKSLMAIRLGEIFSKAFDLPFDENHIAYEPAEFIALLNDEERMKRGSVAILDEAGIAVSNRRWWSDANQAIVSVAQTFGNRGFIVIYTLPHLKFLDAGVARLLNVCIKTYKRPVRSKRHMWGKWYWWRVEPETGKVYRRLPRYWVGSRRKKVKLVKFNFPEEPLIKKYVKATDAYKKKVLVAAEQTARGGGYAKVARVLSKEEVEAIVAKVKKSKRYFNKRGKPIRSLIEHDFDLGEPLAKRVAELVVHGVNP